MKFHLFILFMVCVFVSKTQTINKTFSIGVNEIEETNGLVVKNNKIYIMSVGRTNGVSPWNLAPQLFVFDKFGNKLSSSSNRQLGKNFGAANDHSFIINKNKFLFATTEFNSSSSNEYSKAVLTSYDSLLNINWQHSYIGNKSFFRTIQLTPEGDYLVLGETENIGNGELDVLLIKLDTFGNVLWSKTYGGSEDDRGFSLKILDDGNYLIGAYHVYDITPNGDGWLIKTDTDGNVIWDKYIGGTGADYGIHLFGDHYFYQEKDTMHAYPWDGYAPINYFGMYSPLGNVYWIEEIEVKNGEVLKCALQLQDGGFLMVLSYIDLDYGGNVSWLIKYNANREIVWERYYFADNARSNGLIDVVEDTDGSLVFAGTVLTTDTLYNSDIWLLKLNPDGCLDGGDCGEPIGILDLTIAKETFAIQVNPNPVENFAKIIVKNSANFWGKEMKLSIYNLQGKKVYEITQKLSGQLPVFDIDCRNWRKGLYMVKVGVDGKEFGNAKFLKF